MSDKTQTLNSRSSSWLNSVTVTALAMTFIVPNPMVSKENLLSHRMLDNTSSSMSGMENIWKSPTPDKVNGTQANMPNFTSSGTQILSRKQRKKALKILLHSWVEEGDQQEQSETLDYLFRALDEDRLSYRKLFV